MPRMFGVTGWSGMGKTTLLEALLPRMVAAGLRVAVLKHAHHSFDPDRPGKDSWRHRKAGAAQVLVASAERIAWIRELQGAPEPSLRDLILRLEPCDLVLVEGWKREPMPRLEVWRAAVGKAPVAAEDPAILALALPAGDPWPEALAGAPERLDLDDAQAVLGFVLRAAGAL